MKIALLVMSILCANFALAVPLNSFDAPARASNAQRFQHQRLSGHEGGGVCEGREGGGLN